MRMLICTRKLVAEECKTKGYWWYVQNIVHILRDNFESSKSGKGPWDYFQNPTTDVSRNCLKRLRMNPCLVDAKATAESGYTTDSIILLDLNRLVASFAKPNQN